MDAFLTGFFGSLTGGAMLAGAVYSVYLYEMRQRRKAVAAAKKDINELLAEIKGLSRQPAKSSGKYN